MMSNKIGNKISTTRSNRKTIRRIQTQTDQPILYRKIQVSNKGSQRNYSRQKHVAPYSKINIKDIPSHTRKTFKINTYKQYQNKLLKTQPNQAPRKITTQSQQKSQNVQTKYKIDGVAGKGTFGTVYFGHIRGSGQKIAIKKVLQDKRYKNRELQILKSIRNPSVLQMRDYFMTKQSDKQYLNVVMDFYPCNLYQTIKKKQLSHSLIKIYLYQILRGLNYLKTLSIAHRDIKPQNILIDSVTNKAIICDLGSAKQLIQGQPNLAYICSRCYRAPQLIFGANDYTSQIDMWSLGCVLVEMINGQPPFVGDSQIDQLFEIIKFLGTPTKEDIRDMNHNYDMKEYSKIPSVKKVEWRQVLKTQNNKLIDLVNKMLCYSPEKRLSPSKAMLHPYFDDLRNQDTFKQIQARYKMIPSLFNLTIDELQMFDSQDYPIPKWSQKKYNSQALTKINSISVKRPIHRLV